MTTQEKNGITEGVIWKQLLIFFFPILVGSFFQQLYNTVDSVIVGQFVGKEALSSVGGSAGQIISLVVGFFTGVSTGATVIISQYFGAGKKDVQMGDTLWSIAQKNDLTFRELCELNPSFKGAQLNENSNIQAGDELMNICRFTRRKT